MDALRPPPTQFTPLTTQQNTFTLPTVENVQHFLPFFFPVLS